MYTHHVNCAIYATDAIITPCDDGSMSSIIRIVNDTGTVLITFEELQIIFKAADKLCGGEGKC